MRAERHRWVEGVVGAHIRVPLEVRILPAGLKISERPPRPRSLVKGGALVGSAEDVECRDHLLAVRRGEKG